MFQGNHNFDLDHNYYQDRIYNKLTNPNDAMRALNLQQCRKSLSKSSFTAL